MEGWTDGWTGERERVVDEPCGEDRRPSFCLMANPLLDKQEFTLSVRMKHKRALLPRTGVAGD